MNYTGKFCAVDVGGRKVLVSGGQQCSSIFIW